MDSGSSFVAGQETRDPGTRTWRVAAMVAAVAMVGWLAWHALSAALVLRELQASHVEAAAIKEALWNLEAEIQRTAQLAIATREADWLARHAESEQRLRRLISDLDARQVPGGEALATALVALDNLSLIEARALALQGQGREAEAFDLVTGEDYIAELAGLRRAINTFDARHHAWLLARETGLTDSEVASLSGALLLFGGAIAAWLLLVRRLDREKAALRAEIEARRQAEDELREAERLKLMGQLSGTIAHNFDNVLMAVAGYAGLARNEATRERALAGLERAIRQGEELTDNLLTFLRGEEPGRSPVELGALLREMRDWLEPLMPANLTLEFADQIEGEVWVEVDAGQLRQALVNLALNARDAMPDGGVLQFVRCDSGRAPGCGPGVEGFACLSVLDTGAGMDPATLQRAGTPLFTTKAPGKGTGLGLGSVERFVRSHGGRLEINSAPGGGTRVRLLLPRLPA